MKIADTCRKPVAEKSSVTKPMINDIKGLHFEYSNYYVYDVNGMKIRGVCPLCYMKNRLISILSRTDDEYITGEAHCPVCGTRYGVLFWEMSEETANKIEEYKENRKITFAEIVERSFEKQQ